MESKGIVSLWIGRADSRRAFDAALRVAFDEDGEFLGSMFSRAFAVGYYEDVTREAEYLAPPPGTLAALLAGSSYEDRVLPQFLAISPHIDPRDNCEILLYDYAYSGTVREWHGPGVYLRFVGAVPYE